MNGGQLEMFANVSFHLFNINVMNNFFFSPLCSFVDNEITKVEEKIGEPNELLSDSNKNKYICWKKLEYLLVVFFFN